jgi:hypothetical protein
MLYRASGQALPAHLTTGVSLHSHTSRSKETMSFIPRYVEKVPYLSNRIRHLESEYLKYHGQTFDYSRVWWTPPLEPKAAFDLERNQIQSKLGRKALVSLSDHDNVDAGYALRIFEDCAGAPISTEWTVPLGISFLHIGVHNLDASRARMLEGAMAEVTANACPDAIEAMLDELNRDPHTLVVVNHPLWDEAKLGQEQHVRMVTQFLKRYGRYIHGLELNGLRDPKENQAVERLAEEFDLPLLSGGDRHGCEPNALVNLTSAESFNDFVGEIRDGKPTHTVYMHQYDEPIRLRVLQVMSDVVRTYDEFDVQRRRWSDRIFYRCQDETVRRLSDVWSGRGPDVVGQFIAAMQLVQSRHVRAVLRMALSA